jgi:hypothetical protein
MQFGCSGAVRQFYKIGKKNTLMPRPSFLTRMYTWHMGSRWYTPDFYSHYRHLSIYLTVAYPDVEVKSFNYVYEVGESSLHVGICCKSLASQGLLKKSKKMKNSSTIMKNQSRKCTDGLRITLLALQISI